MPKSLTSIPKRKKPRAHLPALSPASLAIFRSQLDAMPQVSRAAKEAVMQSMTVAANPGAETPEAVIQSLDKEDRDNVMLSMQGYAQTFNGIAARGRNALLMDTSIDELIAQENEEEDN
jgi:hypothetical protein